MGAGHILRLSPAVPNPAVAQATAPASHFCSGRNRPKSQNRPRELRGGAATPRGGRMSRDVPAERPQSLSPPPGLRGMEKRKKKPGWGKKKKKISRSPWKPARPRAAAPRWDGDSPQSGWHRGDTAACPGLGRDALSPCPVSPRWPPGRAGTEGIPKTKPTQGREGGMGVPDGVGTPFVAALPQCPLVPQCRLPGRGCRGLSRCPGAGKGSGCRKRAGKTGNAGAADAGERTPKPREPPREKKKNLC